MSRGTAVNAARRAEQERRTLDRTLDAIRTMRFGTITIVVQDGWVVQFERTEKIRLAARKGGDLSGEDGP